MSPQTFVFFGRSGSGKGTQARLLIEHLKSTDPKRAVLSIETGQLIREFMSQGSYTSKLTSETISEGGLLPAFLPIWIWTEYLIKNFTGEEHLVLDGISRRGHEALVFDSALKFYGREHPFIIHIDVSRAEAKRRLMARRRADDTERDIDRRLDWYESNVEAVLEFFRKKPEYTFLNINGEQSTEKVSQDIISAVGL